MKNKLFPGVETNGTLAKLNEAFSLQKSCQNLQNTKIATPALPVASRNTSNLNQQLPMVKTVRTAKSVK